MVDSFEVIDRTLDYAVNRLITYAINNDVEVLVDYDVVTNSRRFRISKLGVYKELQINDYLLIDAEEIIKAYAILLNLIKNVNYVSIFAEMLENA